VPRVTVIIPAHNAAAVVDAAVRSVFDQTYRDWQLVVADDASSDATVTVLERFAPRVEIVRSETNRGPAAARNLALRQARGELVAFLDADDWWLPEYLERQVARYDAEARAAGAPVGLLACNARIAGPGGFEPRTYCELFRRVEPITLERVLRRNVIYYSAVVPRAVGEHVGWFDESLFGTEDHDLWIKILERGYRAVLTHEPLCVYRRTAGSISLNVARQAANNQKTFHRALRRGHLTARQRRVARSEIRYNRAMEIVASVAFAEGRITGSSWRIVRSLPLLTWVTATRPRHWPEWLAALRSPPVVS
jgi:glycosyltransferase involved in cell wall biosynthesis